MTLRRFLITLLAPACLVMIVFHDCKKPDDAHKYVGNYTFTVKDSSWSYGHPVSVNVTTYTGTVTKVEKHEVRITYDNTRSPITRDLDAGGNIIPVDISYNEKGGFSGGNYTWSESYADLASYWYLNVTGVKK